MSVIFPGQWEEFRALLKRHGYEESDFEVKEVEDVPPTVEPSPIAGSVTITRKGSGLTRTYQGGSGHDWVATFAGDLISGVFGS